MNELNVRHSDYSRSIRSPMGAVFTVLTAAALCVMAASSAWAAVNDGDGTMTVTPSNVTAGASGSNFVFSYRNEAGGAFTAGSQLTLLVPAGWTAPQITNASSPGYVRVVSTAGVATASIVAISNAAPWTVYVNFTANAGTGNGFNLGYTNVTASPIAGTNTFTARTKKSGGTLVELTAGSGSPKIAVKAGPVSKLGIASVNGGSGPTVGLAFSVVVQSQDAYGNAANVVAGTAVSLSLNTGTGLLGGTTNGTIVAGTNAVTISGVTYDTIESGVILTASRTSGDSLLPGNSSPFEVFDWDPDLPGARTNLEMIATGAYIIPMDTNLQNIGSTYFNMKAYGLVNELLHSNIPVKWAISAGKVKDAADFVAYAKRFSPSTNAASSRSFYSGPFIVDVIDTNKAAQIIRSYSNNVAVYQLLSNTIVDVRYTLTHKPRVAVFNDGGNADIHLGYLAEAGFSTNDYLMMETAVTIGTVGPTSCITFCSSPHYVGGAPEPQVAAVREFLESGGNFLVQCHGIDTYENATNGHFFTTGGIGINNTYIAFNYPNQDTPFTQFQGPLSNPGGSLMGAVLLPGSTYHNDNYPVVRYSDSVDHHRAGVSKHFKGSIGSVFF
jgi:hypothetical protein